MVINVRLSCCQMEMLKLEYLIYAVVAIEICLLVVQTSVMYTSPIGKPDVPMLEMAHLLLDCGRFKIPEKRLVWNLISVCVDQSHIRPVRAGKMPYAIYQQHPTAWVFRYFDKTNIFTAPVYGNLSPLSRAAVIIHECTHLTLQTEDYAYSWEKHFHNLTQKQHDHNADSFVAELQIHCLK